MTPPMTAMPANSVLALLPFAAPVNGDGEGGDTGAPVPLGEPETMGGEPAGGMGMLVPLGAATGVVVPAGVVGKGAVALEE